MNPILDQINVVARKVFLKQDLELNPDSVASDVDGWDSLMHVSLIVNIEKSFGVRFSSRELGKFKRIGDIVEALEVKVAEKAVQ